MIAASLSQSGADRLGRAPALYARARAVLTPSKTADMPAQYTPDPIVTPEEMQQAIAAPPHDPSMWAKFSRKFKEEPLVPLGTPFPLPPDWCTAAGPGR